MFLFALNVIYKLDKIVSYSDSLVNIDLHWHSRNSEI